MKKAMWRLMELREDIPQTCIKNKWVPVRPENFKREYLEIWKRIYYAWQVFKGRAETFTWPEQDISHET